MNQYFYWIRPLFVEKYKPNLNSIRYTWVWEIHLTLNPFFNCFLLILHRITIHLYRSPFSYFEAYSSIRWFIFYFLAPISSGPFEESPNNNSRFQTKQSFPETPFKETSFFIYSPTITAFYTNAQRSTSRLVSCEAIPTRWLFRGKIISHLHLLVTTGLFYQYSMPILADISIGFGRQSILILVGLLDRPWPSDIYAGSGQQTIDKLCPSDIKGGSERYI